MPLNPVAQAVVHRADLKVRLIHPESTLNKPQIMVVGNHFFIGQLGIGHISFETIPDCILLKSLKIDTYGSFALKPEVFIVAPIVDVLLTYLS